MIEIVFARHGSTQWNRDKRLQGLNDQPILKETEYNFSQLSLPKQYKDLPVFCSPLIRAQQTLKAMGLDRYTVTPEVIESDFGDWEGLTADQVRAKYPQGPEGHNGLDYKIHNGESNRDVQERVIPWALRQSQSCFVMSHKNLITSVYAYASGWTMESQPEHRLDYKKIHSFFIENGDLKIGRLNQDYIQKDSL